MLRCCRSAAGILSEGFAECVYSQTLCCKGCHSGLTRVIPARCVLQSHSPLTTYHAHHSPRTLTSHHSTHTSHRSHCVSLTGASSACCVQGGVALGSASCTSVQPRRVVSRRRLRSPARGPIRPQPASLHIGEARAVTSPHHSAVVRRD